MVLPQRPISQEVTASTSSDLAKVELASRRTGMAFQRTRLAADRTLMAVIRTALALISFGFTIFQVFEKLEHARVITMPAHTPRNFGVVLVLLGVAMLLLGMAYHLVFMLALRRMRRQMTEEGLIEGQTVFPPSMTLITALLLLAIGLAAFSSMVFKRGPLQMADLRSDPALTQAHEDVIIASRIFLRA